MPHLTLKHFKPELTSTQKQALSDAFTKAIIETVKCEETVVSISFESIQPNDWYQSVFKPEISSQQNLLFKHPEYEMTETEENTHE